MYKILCINILDIVLKLYTRSMIGIASRQGVIADSFIDLKSASNESEVTILKKLLIEIPDEIYNYIKEHNIVSGIQNKDYVGLSCEVQAAIREGKVLSEQTVIFTKDDVLSILKDLRISMDATASDLQYKIDKVDSLQGNVIKNYCDGCEHAYLCYGVATNSCKTYQSRKQEDLKKNGRDV